MYSKLKTEINESIKEALTKLRIKYDDEIILEEYCFLFS